MRLEDVTAIQAIQVICQSQNYDLSQANGVYYVKTAAEKALKPPRATISLSAMPGRRTWCRC